MTRIIYFSFIAFLLSGCITVDLPIPVEGEIPTLVGNSITAQKDPSIVFSALPTYIIVNDALITNNPEDVDYLFSGSSLYSLYSTFYADLGNQERALELAERSYMYASSALCLVDAILCTSINERDFISFSESLGSAHVDSLDSIWLFTLSWSNLIRTQGATWESIAFLPWLQMLLETVIVIDPYYQNGSPYEILAITQSLIPPSLGGKLDQANENFNFAFEYSNGENLGARVSYAEYYARAIFDQELHDQVLTEVIESNIESKAFNLFNTKAKERALYLLEGSDEYFN